MIRISNTLRIFFAQSGLASLLFFPLVSGFEITANNTIPSTHRLANSIVYPDSVSSGSFSVLTYNIAGLPEIISSAATKRAPSIAEIGRRMNVFDIVNVQEDFNYNQDLYGSGNTHAFRTDTKGVVPFGDGLNTLSRYSIKEIRRIPWDKCTGADCLTPKGFTYCRLEIARNTFIDLYNVHANAYNHLPAAEARRDNLKQLSRFIKEKSEGQAVLMMGDLNAHYSYFYDNVYSLLEDNGLKDSWLVLMHQDTLPLSSKELPESKILSINNGSESIDKILYRSNDRIQLTPSNYNLEKQLFQDHNGVPLSDHHAVSLRFAWKIKGTRPEKEIQSAIQIAQSR